MEKINFNESEDPVRVGNQLGAKLSDGNYLLRFVKAKPQRSRNTGAGTTGNLMAIYEFDLLEVISGGDDQEVDFGPEIGKVSCTAHVGQRYSLVLKLNKDAAKADHNELAGYLHNVDMGDGPTVRSIFGGTNAEQAAKFNQAIWDCMEDKNPLMGMLLGCSVRLGKVDKGRKNFLFHKFSLPKDQASQEANAAIIEKFASAG